MGVLIVNNTGEPLTVHDFFILDASSGFGVSGAKKYKLLPNRHRRLSNSIFTRQTINERKLIEIRCEIQGKKRLVLHHEVFEKNEAIIFVIEDVNKLAVNVVQRVAARGFADWIWGMFPSCGSAANSEALIAAANPLKP